jgi:hypothetical protein
LITDDNYSFASWAAERRKDPLLPQDAALVQSRLKAAPTKLDPLPPQVASKTTKRGRPPKRYANPVSRVLPLLEPADEAWLFDVIYGSIATAAGSKEGRLQVRPSWVRLALYLDDITAAGAGQDGMSLRSAQEVAKAARHAAQGVHSYIERHPQVETRLMAIQAIEEQLSYYSN